MLKVLLVVVTIVYPGLVYLGLAYFRPGTFGLLIALIALLRFGVLRGREQRWMLVPVLFLLAYAVTVARTDSEPLVRLYPVFVNVALLGLFGWTLLRPPSIIERLSRARGMEISPAGIPYMRNLTGLWCVFFVANAAVATWTAIGASRATWALYNGLLVYLLLALLVGIELIVRRRYRRRHGVETGGSSVGSSR